jgi:hypothetical protein
MVSSHEVTLLLLSPGLVGSLHLAKKPFEGSLEVARLAQLGRLGPESHLATSLLDQAPISEGPNELHSAGPSFAATCLVS